LSAGKAVWKGGMKSAGVPLAMPVFLREGLAARIGNSLFIERLLIASWRFAWCNRNSVMVHEEHWRSQWHPALGAAKI
jgi:hypothetical protein